MQNKEKLLLERKEAIESQNSTLLATVLNSNECLIIKKRISLRKASKKFKYRKSTISKILEKMKKPIACCERLKR